MYQTRPVAEDIRPPIDMTAPCKLCGSDVEGSDGIWVHWDLHLTWHQWLWDLLHPAGGGS
jgi:hypothetical protein